MSTNNHPFQVLVPSGDQALLAAGNDIATLGVGQLGVFSYEHNLSIDGSVLQDARAFYIGVGLDRNGDAAMDDVLQSAGTHIQRANIRGYNLKCYSPGQNKVIDLTGLGSTACETEYMVKFELRGNGTAYKNYGYNQFVKTYSVVTGCCEPCADCPDGDCNELAQLLIAAVNEDQADEGIILASATSFLGEVVLTAEPTADGNVTVTVGSTAVVVAILDADTLITAAAKVAAALVAAGIPAASDGVDTVTVSADTATTITYVDTDTTGMTATAANATITVIADVAAHLAAFPGDCLGVRFEVLPTPLENYCITNLKYTNIRQFDMIPTLLDGFECMGTLTTAQDLAYVEGSGYDVQQLEYQSSGWRKSPYKAGELAGVEFPNSVERFSSKTGKYTLINLAYDLESVAGWGEHLNNLETIIAVPCEDTATLASLLGVLDTMLGGASAGYGPLADDAARCPDCSVQTAPDTTSGINNVNLDGLG